MSQWALLRPVVGLWCVCCECSNAACLMRAASSSMQVPLDKIAACLLPKKGALFCHGRWAAHVVPGAIE